MDTAQSAPACPNCGAAASGRYCARCGEELRRATSGPLRDLVARARDARAGLAPSSLRTFVALIRSPGLLTCEYLAGRRRRYLRPLQLFLLCNVVYFFLQPRFGMDMLSTPLRTHMSLLPYSGLAAGMVSDAVARRGGEWTTYSLVFDTTLDHLSRSLVIVLGPMGAAAVGLVQWRRLPARAPFVFALHFYAFALLVSPPLFALIILVLHHALGGVLSRDNLGEVLQLAPILVWAVYLYLALRRVYGQRRGLSAIKAMVLLAATLAILQIYRFILFLVTFYSV